MSLGINIQSITSNKALASPIFSFLRNDDVSRATTVSRIFKKATDDYNQFLAANRRINPSLIFVSFKDNKIELPNNHITKKTFTKDPLFKDTNEKKNVFNELVKITKKNGFLALYSEFVSKLKQPNWFELCKDNPIESSYLSILAFFDGEINAGELFVIHSVAMAYIDLKKDCNDEIGIVDVQTRVLKTDEIVKYIEEPFFDFDSDLEDDLSSMLTDTRLDLDGARVKFLREVTKISYIERTFLECTLSPYLSFHSRIMEQKPLDRSELSIFTEIAFQSKCRTGFKLKKRPDGKLEDKIIAVFPSIRLAVDLLRCVSKFGEKLQNPMLMFGHAMRYDVLFGGRPITGASPLFKSRAPHGFKRGPIELGMLFHDICFHLFEDASIPHVNILIEIGRKLLDEDLSKFDINEIKYFRNFAGEILDRDACEYRTVKSRDAFWTFLIHRLQFLNKKVSENSFEKYFNEFFSPKALEILQKYLEKKRNYGSITEKSPSEILSMVKEDGVY